MTNWRGHQEGLQAWANDFGEPDPRCREVHDFECDDIDAVADLCISLDKNNIDEHSSFFHCSDYVDKTAAHIACLIDGCTDRSTLCGSLGSYAKQCLNAIPSSLRHNVCSWATESGCEQECGANSVFEGCASTCQAQKTCRNRHKSDAERCGATINEIKSMCVCEPGYVLDNGNCVLEADCGCVWDFNGVYYSQGASFSNEEETCECTSEGVVCTPIPCETTGRAYCRSHNDPYIKTFDGYQYGFHGNCRYNLASAPDSDDVPGFSLDSKNRKPNLPFSGTVTDELWFDFHGSNYAFEDEKRFSFYVRNLDDSESYGNSRFEVTFIDNQTGETIIDAVSTLSSNLDLTTEDYRVILLRSADDTINYVRVDTSNDVRFDFYYIYWSARLFVNGCYKNVMTGLCGNYNSNDSEERILAIDYANESEDFGDRFQTDDDETCAHGDRLRPCEDLDSAAYNAAADRCDIVDQNPQISTNQNFFRGCEFLGNRSPFYEACLFNSCLERDLHCGIIGDYASQCLARKTPGSADYERICGWASKSGCQEECAASEVFKGCTTFCYEQQTCEDVAREISKEDRCADSGEQVEGMCGCPEGEVLDEGVCVPENSCGCINEAGEYAAVGSKVNVGSNECTCLAGGEYECVPIGCPCDAFDEECIDFVCEEPRDFVGGAEGIVGTFQVSKNYELAYEYTCAYPTESGEHIGPHIFDGDMSRIHDFFKGKSTDNVKKNSKKMSRSWNIRGNMWFFHSRSMPYRAWIGHENNSDGLHYYVEWLENEVACVPGFNSIRITQEHDADTDAITKQFFFNGVLINTYSTTSSQNMYTGELTASLAFVGTTFEVPPGQIRNFYYRYTDRECFIGDTPEVSGGRVGLKEIDLQKSFKISLELDCNEPVIGTNSGTIMDIRDLEGTRAEGSPDPALSTDVNSDESNRVLGTERILTTIYRYSSWTFFVLYNGPGATQTDYENFNHYISPLPYTFGGGILTMRYWLDGCPGDGWTSFEFEHRFDDETGLWTDMWKIGGVPYVSSSYSPESWTHGNDFYLGLANGPIVEGSVNVRNFCYQKLSNQ